MLAPQTLLVEQFWRQTTISGNILNIVEKINMLTAMEAIKPVLNNLA